MNANERECWSPGFSRRWSSGFSLRSCRDKSLFAPVVIFQCHQAWPTTTVKLRRLKPELQLSYLRVSALSAVRFVLIPAACRRTILLSLIFLSVSFLSVIRVIRSLSTVTGANEKDEQVGKPAPRNMIWGTFRGGGRLS